MSKEVIYRSLARKDIEESAAYYAGKEPNLVTRFLDALDDAARYISRYPPARSQQFGVLLSIPELRNHHMKSFPYLLFYRETAVSIEVYRVLHAQRDIFTTLAAPPSD